MLFVVLAVIQVLLLVGVLVFLFFLSRRNAVQDSGAELLGGLADLRSSSERLQVTVADEIRTWRDDNRSYSQQARQESAADARSLREELLTNVDRLWYWNLSEAELDPLLTDASGVRRGYAVPPGTLHPDQESKQRKIAERVLPPAFKELLRATKEPFVQAIMDLACPQLVFNRAILMGDASFVIRPHTAASTSKGIANAFTLVGELAGRQELSESLDHWQRSELNRGQRLMSYGQGLGRSQGR